MGNFLAQAVGFDRAWLMQVCTFAKTHWILHLKFVHFAICKIYLKRIKKIW